MLISVDKYDKIFAEATTGQTNKINLKKYNITHS